MLDGKKENNVNNIWPGDLHCNGKNHLFEKMKKEKKKTNKKKTVLKGKVEKWGTRTVSDSASAEVWSLMAPVTHNQFMSFVVLHLQTMHMSSFPCPPRMGSIILYTLKSANASKIWPS